MTEWGSSADLDFRDRNMGRNKPDTEPNGLYYQGIAFERERIIEIIKSRRDYDCRCQCNCHDVPAPCASCEADNELIKIIRGEK